MNKKIFFYFLLCIIIALAVFSKPSEIGTTIEQYDYGTSTTVHMSSAINTPNLVRTYNGTMFVAMSYSNTTNKEIHVYRSDNFGENWTIAMNINVTSDSRIAHASELNNIFILIDSNDIIYIFAHVLCGSDGHHLAIYKTTDFFSSLDSDVKYHIESLSAFVDEIDEIHMCYTNSSYGFFWYSNMNSSNLLFNNMVALDSTYSDLTCDIANKYNSTNNSITGIVAFFNINMPMKIYKSTDNGTTFSYSNFSNPVRYNLTRPFARPNIYITDSGFVVSYSCDAPEGICFTSFGDELVPIGVATTKLLATFGENSRYHTIAETSNKKIIVASHDIYNRLIFFVQPDLTPQYYGYLTLYRLSHITFGASVYPNNMVASDIMPYTFIDLDRNLMFYDNFNFYISAPFLTSLSTSKSVFDTKDNLALSAKYLSKNRASATINISWYVNYINTINSSFVVDNSGYTFTRELLKNNYSVGDVVYANISVFSSSSQVLYEENYYSCVDVTNTSYHNNSGSPKNCSNIISDGKWNIKEASPLLLFINYTKPAIFETAFYKIKMMDLLIENYTIPYSCLSYNSSFLELFLYINNGPNYFIRCRNNTDNWGFPYNTTFTFNTSLLHESLNTYGSSVYGLYEEAVNWVGSSYIYEVGPFLIRNATPVISSVNITPPQPAKQNILWCNYTTHDSYDTVVYRWYKNDVMQTRNLHYINNTDTKLGDSWKCSVQLNIFNLSSIIVNSSDAVVLDNQSPSVASVEISNTIISSSSNVRINAICMDNDSSVSYVSVNITKPNLIVSEFELERTGINLYSSLFTDVTQTGLYTVDKVYCRDSFGNVFTSNLSLSFNSVASTEPISSGGGSSSSVLVKRDCNITVEPNNILMQDLAKVERFVIKNNDEVSITPVYSITGNLFEIRGDISVIMPGKIEEYTVLRLYDYENITSEIVTITTATCNDIILNITYAPSLLPKDIVGKAKFLKDSTISTFLGHIFIYGKKINYYWLAGVLALLVVIFLFFTKITIVQRIASAVFLLLLFNIVLANTLTVVPFGVGNSTFTNSSVSIDNDKINKLSDNLQLKNIDNIKVVTIIVIFVLLIFILLLFATFLKISWLVKLPAVILIVFVCLYFFYNEIHNIVGVFI